MINPQLKEITVDIYEEAMSTTTITVSTEDGCLAWYYLPPKKDWSKVKISLTAEEMEEERKVLRVWPR